MWDFRSHRACGPKVRSLTFNLRESKIWELKLGWVTSWDLYLRIILAAVWRMTHQGAKTETGR